MSEQPYEQALVLDAGSGVLQFWWRYEAATGERIDTTARVLVHIYDCLPAEHDAQALLNRQAAFLAVHAETDVPMPEDPDFWREVVIFCARFVLADPTWRDVPDEAVN